MAQQNIWDGTDETWVVYVQGKHPTCSITPAFKETFSEVRHTGIAHKNREGHN